MNDHPEGLLRSEERSVVGTETDRAGAVRAKKSVTQQTTELTVARGTEHADLQREAVDSQDDGQVRVLPDGSVSVPVFEERLVVTKQLVVRERVVLRKHTVYEEHLVSADLRTEHLEVDVDAAVADRVRTGPEQPEEAAP